ERTAREVLGAQLDHALRPVRPAPSGQPAGRIAPEEEDPRHLRHPPTGSGQPEEEVPVLGPARVAPASDRVERLAAEDGAGMHQGRLDETGRRALLPGNHRADPPPEPSWPRRERAGAPP